MNDEVNKNYYIDTYLAKQEGLVLEYIRKFLQAETKIALLEQNTQALQKKLAESNEQLEISRVTIDQSLSGLKAVTFEKDKLTERVKSYEAELIDYKDKLNKALIAKTELESVYEKLDISEQNLSTLQQNYNKVLATLTQSDDQQLDKKKKLKNPDSEWTDGK